MCIQKIDLCSSHKIVQTTVKPATMKVFICLIVIRLICSQQVLYKDLRGFQNTQFTNLKILENSLNSRASVRNLLVCSAFCLENSRCLSCAFNNIRELCVLWDKDFINVSKTDVVPEDGWKYYYVIKGLYILFSALYLRCQNLAVL